MALIVTELVASVSLVPRSATSAARLAADTATEKD